jgi:hypothetical protein
VAIFRLGISLIAAASLSACATSGSVKQAGLAYNKGLAEGRDGVILRNILRAAGREPLYFSAVTQVTSSGKATGALGLGASLIGGGDDTFSPTLSLGGEAGPSIQVSPLGDKEFTSGLLKPLEADKVNLFMAQNWNKDFLLPLIVASVKCSKDDTPIVNGENDDDYRDKLAANAKLIFLEHGSKAPLSTTLSLASTDAASLLSKGLPEGWEIEGVKQEERGGAVTVTMSKAGEKSWQFRGTFPKCAVGSKNFATDDATGGPGEGEVVLRSTEAIIYFLGEKLRNCFVEATASTCRVHYPGRKDSSLLVVSRGPKPSNVAIMVEWHHSFYWIDRLRAGSENQDYSLKTLSFISQLIALQITPDALKGSATVLAIGGQ